jgi:hypothetical protein
MKILSGSWLKMKMIMRLLAANENNNRILFINKNENLFRSLLLGHRLLSLIIGIKKEPRNESRRTLAVKLKMSRVILKA